MDARAFPTGNYVRVFLRDIEVHVRCGLHPWERHPEHPNRLLVSVELFAAWPLAYANSDGSRYIDYDALRAHVLGWESRPHVDLLETLLDDLTQAAFTNSNVEACRVSISKPDIFTETAGAGVEFIRVRGAG